jgi:hypothetical protein
MKKPVLIIICMLLCLACGCAGYADAPPVTAAPAADTPTTLHIESDARLLYSEYPVDDWSYEVTVDGDYATDGDNLIVESGSLLEIMCYIYENDPVIDYGYSDFTIDTSRLYAGRNTYSCGVTVKKDRGENTGSADWQFTVVVTKE